VGAINKNCKTKKFQQATQKLYKFCLHSKIMAVKKGGKKTRDISRKQEELIGKLIDNFTNMQAVLTNVSIKFDNLASQISKMLELFEISAKSLAEKKAGKTAGEKFLEKLDEALEQNKTIARGMVLIGERLGNIESKETQQPAPPKSFPPKRTRPLPRY